MKQIGTHYDNLKVARNAPLEVIRAAYRALSQKHHPDKNGGSPESQRMMKIINESYAVLSDPETRKKHDDWIRQQESYDAHSEQPAKNKNEIEFPLPVSGQFRFNELDEETQKRIEERASGIKKDQYAIKLDGVIWNYVWIILLSGWICYIYTDALDYRWSSETTYWYLGLTAGVWFLLSKNISWIYSWHFKPLKSWLVVTPLYVMRFHLDQIHYWPIWTISDIKATHNYRNGSYQYTSLSITLDGKNEIFSISPENAYQIMLNRLQEYDQKFRMAVESYDVAYIVSNDDFINVVNKTGEENRAKHTSSIVIYIIGITCFRIFLGRLR